MFTRIALFLATNLAVLILAGIVMSILGVDSRSMSGLLVMAGIFGFGGSFISLLLSKWMAKRSTGAVVITEPRNPTERWLLATVERQAKAAGIGMPEVAVYEGPEINAFATGANRNNALVAVSTGLLHNMSEDEAEAVLGHEIAHVANGDMITMALLQGVLNTFVIVLARVVGGIIDSALSGNREGGGRGFAYFIIDVVLAPPRVPRRRGRCLAGRPPEDDRRAGAPSAQPRPEHAADPDCRVRYCRFDREEAVHEPSAAGRAHRRAAGVNGGVSFRYHGSAGTPGPAPGVFVCASTYGWRLARPGESHFRDRGGVSLSLLVQRK
jgi:Peptidase family M48